MRKIWLTFAQATTIALAVWLVIATMRPDLLPSQGSGNGGVVTITESAGPRQQKDAGTGVVGS